MLNAFRFLFIFMAFVLPLSHTADSEEQKIIVAEERFVDNEDGTVMDTKRRIMWQKGDNGKVVTLEEAQRYCKTLRLGAMPIGVCPNPTIVAVMLSFNRNRELFIRHNPKALCNVEVKRIWFLFAV
jgi:hypothetical protein